MNEDNEENIVNNHLAALRYQRSIRGQIRALVDPYRVTDNLFRATFRLNKDLARVLIRELTPYLNNDEDVLAVPNSIKVLSVLHFYGHGGYQATVGGNWLACIGRSTAGRFIEEVTNALNNREIQERYIKFPRTRQARRELQEKHQQIFRIPGVVGFVDGTEVSIVTPPENMNPQGFWTRKHQYALNCQIACDSDLSIIAVNANYPGANGDAFIWANSGLRRRMMEAFAEDQTSWLLGDSAYPGEPWLLKPILGGAEGSPEAYFTEKHCKARCSVERCYGVMKGRFRCLLRDRVLHYHPEKAGRIVKACCVLHNMCRMAGLPDNDVVINVGEEDGIPWVNNEAEAFLEEAEEEADEELQVQNLQDRNEIGRVGTIVRQRVVDFLEMYRHLDV